MVTDLTNVKDNWVYQGNKLIEASYSLTLMEQKLIRVLASMIKKDDNEFKEYEFKAKELSKILNVDIKNIYRELDNTTDKLMTRFIKIKDDNKQKFMKRHLIDIADFENGMLKLRIHNDMKEFYLKLNWYTKYQLKNVLQFKSSYSFRFYELLKQYQTIGHRTFTIEDLRVILDIEKNQYPKYANLKQKVIMPAVKETNSKTDIHIEFEELKESRKVSAIKFYIKAASSNVPAPEEEIASTVASDNLYNSELILKVRGIFSEEVTELEASRILAVANNDLSIIREKYNIAKQSSSIKNIVGWVIKAIQDDYKTQRKVGTFNNYEQRTYDFDELEKKLLGWE